MNRTEAALISRNVDQLTAERLRKAGWTLAKLKQCPPTQLNELGLDNASVDAILDGGRPPIPIDTLVSVLFANRFICCVCRNPRMSIVVHHISPWAKSRDHSPWVVAPRRRRAHLSLSSDRSTLSSRRKQKVPLSRMNLKRVIYKMRAKLCKSPEKSGLTGSHRGTRYLAY